MLSILLLLNFACVSYVDAFHVTAKPLPLKATGRAAFQKLERPVRRLASTAGSKRILSRTTALRSITVKQGSIEIGVQTAQLLMNPKKHDLLKRDIVQKYPFLPGAGVDSCINIVAAAFKTIAPDTLEQALQPGGMAKVRPVLKDAVVSAVLEQKYIKYSPLLSTTDKTKVVGSLVDLALDQLLKDSEYLLQRPEIRLEALEEEIRMIQKTEMTTTQILLYRYRKHPVLWSVAVLWLSFYSYAQLVHAGSYKAAAVTLQRSAMVVARGLASAAQRVYAVAVPWARNQGTRIHKFVTSR